MRSKRSIRRHLLQLLTRDEKQLLTLHPNPDLVSDTDLENGLVEDWSYKTIQAVISKLNAAE